MGKLLSTKNFAEYQYQQRLSEDGVFKKKFLGGSTSNKLSMTKDSLAKFFFPFFYKRLVEKQTQTL